MAVERCRPKVRRPVRERAAPVARVSACCWCGVRRVRREGVWGWVCRRGGRKVGRVVAMVERRSGARKRAPMVEAGRLNGRGWKRREREVARPQREDDGKKVVTARRAVVGVTKARGACRRMAMSAEPL
jgi:hypothetical protein